MELCQSRSTETFVIPKQKYALDILLPSRVIIRCLLNFTELLKKSKFYKNAKEEIGDAFKKVPELNETKDFATKKIEMELMNRFFDGLWNLFKPYLIQDVRLPLIVSRDPVSPTFS